VLLAAGLGLALLGTHLFRQTKAFLARAVRVEGRVVELVTVSSSDGGYTYAPVVEFRHPGGAARFKDSVSSRPASYSVGDPAPVLYDPADPKQARIDRGVWNRIIPLLIAAMGGVFFAAGLLVMLKR
jgi:hypothetical protein